MKTKKIYKLGICEICAEPFYADRPLPTSCDELTPDELSFVCDCRIRAKKIEMVMCPEREDPDMIQKLHRMIWDAGIRLSGSPSIYEAVETMLEAYDKLARADFQRRVLETNKTCDHDGVLKLLADHVALKGKADQLRELVKQAFYEGQGIHHDESDPWPGSDSEKELEDICQTHHA